MNRRDMLLKSKKDTPFYRLIGNITEFASLSSQNHLPAYASQASFFMIISVVPFLMLFLTILRLFIPLDEAMFTNMVLDFLPRQVEDFAKRIIGELYSNVSVSVISITTIALLWAAAKGVKSIVTGLKNIYGTTTSIDFILNIILSLAYTLMFIVMLLLTIAVLVFGRMLNELIFAELPFIKGIINDILGFRNILFLLPLTLFFTFSYRFLAKNELPFYKHLFGAFLSALGWMIFSFFFGVYVDNFSNYSYIYGSLAAVVLLMLWLYACMTMFLLGAQANVWFYKKGWGVKASAKYIKSRIRRKGKIKQ